MPDCPPLAFRVRAPWVFSLLLLTTLVAACGSGGGDPDPDPDPNPNPPPPPPGTLAVTSVSSLNPWLGDTITVTGSGFSTTPGQNIVRFPTCTPAGAACSLFAPVVLEATATQLKVQLPHAPMNARIATGTIRVAVSGTTATGPAMTFRIPVAHRFIENHDYHFDPPYLRAADSLEFIVQGFNPSGGSLTIDGVAQSLLTMTPEVAELGQYRVTVKEPPRIMGPGLVQDPGEEFRATVRVASNGRDYTSEERAYRVPRFSLSGITPTEMSVGSLVSVSLAGYNMPGSITLVWSREVQGNPQVGTSGTSGCSGFCDEVTGPPPPGVGEGTWTVRARFTMFLDATEYLVGTVTVAP